MSIHTAKSITYTALAETGTAETVAASEPGEFHATISRECANSEIRPVEALLLVFVALVP